MKYYSISYIKKWDSTKKEIQRLTKEEIFVFLRQVRKWIASLDWVLIEWIYSLDYFQIMERNFPYKEWNEYFVDYTHTHWNWKTEDIEISLSEFANMIDADEDEILDKSEKDVTNELLYKYNIIWKDFYKKGVVLFENNIISADWVDFKLEKGAKIYEVFDLLFRAKSFYKKNHFTYDELKELYKFGTIKYMQIQACDLNEFSIKDIVRKKLNYIKKQTQMENRILKIIPEEISIWQETAM